MKSLRIAQRKIAACESEIKALITDLVQSGNYEEIPELAALAARLAELSGGHSKQDRVPSEPASVRAENAKAPSGPAKPKPKSLDYPRFERTEDRLFKLGWSKKDREEYEHKTSRLAAKAVFDAITTALSGGEYVRVEAITPVLLADEEVPSYQVYLVVAWLRDRGALDKPGIEGYRIKKALWNFEELWKTTSER